MIRHLESGKTRQMPPRHTAFQPQRLAFIDNKQGYHNNIMTKKEGEIWNLQVQKDQKRRKR